MCSSSTAYIVFSDAVSTTYLVLVEIVVKEPECRLWWSMTAGRVTSLVTKRDLTLALQIEDAMSRGQSLEALTSSRETLELRKQQELVQKRKQKSMQKDERGNFKTAKFEGVGRSGLSASKSGSKKPSSSSSPFKPLKGTRGKARFESSDKKAAESSAKKPVGFFIRKK